MAGFVMTRQASPGKWGAATYALQKTGTTEEHRGHRGHRPSSPLLVPPCVLSGDKKGRLFFERQAVGHANAISLCSARQLERKKAAAWKARTKLKSNYSKRAPNAGRTNRSHLKRLMPVVELAPNVTGSNPWHPLSAGPGTVHFFPGSWQ
jgi:hypothetical protein